MGMLMLSGMINSPRKRCAVGDCHHCCQGASNQGASISYKFKARNPWIKQCGLLLRWLAKLVGLPEQGDLMRFVRVLIGKLVLKSLENG